MPRCITINTYRYCRTILVTLLILTSVVSSFFPVSAHASINQVINYQGKLTDSSGTAVPDGNYSITFRLYTVTSGGSNIWTETQTVPVAGGLFSVLLGSSTSLAPISFNQTLYLGVNVGGDGEMTPRKTIGSVPSAFTSDYLDGLDSADFLSTSTASAPKLFSLSGLGQIGSSSATSTILGNLATIGTSIFSGLVSAYQQISAPYFTATSTTQASTFPYASTTAISVATTASTTNLIVSTNSTLGTVTAGIWNGTTIGIGYGGTGVASTPSYGQILVGNNSSGYTLLATSSLGITASQWTNVTGGINYSGGNVGVGTSTPGAKLAVTGSGTGTGHAFSVANSSDVEKFYITDNGAAHLASTLFIQGGGSLQWGDSGIAGSITGFLSNSSDGVFRFGDSAGGGSPRIILGSASASWPSLKRNGAGIDIRLGDDSGYASTTASLFNATSNTASWFPYASTTGITSSGSAYFATSGGNLAVGTSSPWATLAINPTAGGANNQFVVGSSTATNFIINNSGNVGVGTTSPFAKLSVDGNIMFQGNNFATTTIGRNLSYLQIKDYFINGFNAYIPTLFGRALGTDIGTINAIGINNGLIITEDHTPGNVLPSISFAEQGLTKTGSITFATSTGQLQFNATDGGYFFDSNEGNVGIGTSNPSEALTVSGNFRLTGGFFDRNNSVGTNGYILQTTGAGTEWVATSSLGFTASSLGITAGSLGITSSQWADVTGGINYNSGNVGVATATPWAKLSITNTGTNPSFLVEDSTSPDTTPFIIDANGNVGVGTSTPYNGYKLAVNGSAYFAGNISMNPNASFSLGTTTLKGQGGGLFIESTNADINGAEFVRYDNLASGATSASFTQAVKSTYNQGSSTASVSNSAFYGVLNVTANEPTGNLNIMSSAVYGHINTGVANTSQHLAAVRGNVSGLDAMTSKSIFGGYFTNSASASSTYGIYAESTGTDLVPLANNYYGVYGSASKSTVSGGVNYGIYGDAFGANTNWAGYFNNGNVYVKNNLGVGTTSPFANLSVDGQIAFQGTNFATTTIGSKSSYIQTGDYLLSGGLGVNHFPYFTFNSPGGSLSGRLGGFMGGVGLLEDKALGDNDPALLFISADAFDTGNVASITFSTSTSQLQFSSAAGGYSFDGKVFMTGLSSSLTGNAVCITAGNEITNAGAASCVPSSIRFKENVADLDATTTEAIIEALRVVTFDYKPGAYSPEDGKESIGLIAEEVDKVDKRLVDYGFDGKPLTLKFERLAALAIKGIQDLWVKVNDHEARLQKLEKDNVELKARLDALTIPGSNIQIGGGASSSGGSTNQSDQIPSSTDSSSSGQNSNTTSSTTNTSDTTPTSNSGSDSSNVTPGSSTETPSVDTTTSSDSNPTSTDSGGGGAPIQ